MIHGKQIKDNSIRESKLNILGNLNANNQKIINLALPVSDLDAANKKYVDAVSQGLIVKDAVKLATSALSDLSGFTYNSANDIWSNVTTPTFDNVSLSDGDRVIIKDASDARGNGIWQFNLSTSQFVRTDDANNSGSPNLNELRGGSFVFVTSGDTLSDTGWVISSPDGDIVLGTDNITWSQFSGAGSITAGDGLTKSGTTLDVNVDGTTLEISTDTVQVKNFGIDENKLNSSVAGAGLTGGSGSALSVNVDGTSIEISADTLQIVDGGVDENKLNSSVAGAGLTGGSGSALSVNVDSINLEIVANSIQIKDSSIDLSKIDNTIFGTGFTILGSPNTLSIDLGNSLEFSGNSIEIKVHPSASVSIDSSGLKAATLYERYTAPSSNSSGGTDFNTGITMTETPAGNSTILVFVNGVKNSVSYGDKTGMFWFEPSGGGSARAQSDIVLTDELHFNPTLSGFDLETIDEIELVYSKIQ